jgi:hypothetical protein
MRYRRRFRIRRRSRRRKNRGYFGVRRYRHRGGRRM